MVTKEMNSSLSQSMEEKTDALNNLATLKLNGLQFKSTQTNQHLPALKVSG
jgi:hypothetical protein